MRCVIRVKRADRRSQTSQDWREAHSGDPEPSPFTSLPARGWGCLGARPGDTVPQAWSPLPSAAAEPGLRSVPSVPCPSVTAPAGCWLATLLRGAGGHYQHPGLAFTPPGRTKGWKRQDAARPSPGHPGKGMGRSPSSTCSSRPAPGPRAHPTPMGARAETAAGRQPWRGGRGPGLSRDHPRSRSVRMEPGHWSAGWQDAAGLGRV